MCECINEIEKKLTKHMKEQYPTGFEILDEVSFQNKSYLLDKGKIILINPVLGRVVKGKKVKKYEITMMPSYCPFCGEKI